MDSTERLQKLNNILIEKMLKSTYALNFIFPYKQYLMFIRKLYKTLITILIFSFSVITNKVLSQPIDTLVDVGTHKLHFNIWPGKGTPILFEAGNGDDASVWNMIPSVIHQKTGTTIITYDRAGLGKSEIDTLNNSFQNEVRDLEIALTKLGYFKSLLIVCHSFGAYYSSLFTYNNLKKVKAVLCIDIATPCFFTKEWSEDFIKSLKPEDWQMIRQYKIGLYYVLKEFYQIADFMGDKFFSSKTPVTMIMAENIQSMIKSEEKEKWIACCRQFGRMPNHSFKIARNADHKVWLTNSEMVINEVIKLYKKFR